MLQLKFSISDSYLPQLRITEGLFSSASLQSYSVSWYRTYVSCFHAVVMLVWFLKDSLVPQRQHNQQSTGSYSLPKTAWFKLVWTDTTLKSPQPCDTHRMSYILKLNSQKLLVRVTQISRHS
jgi:hypothetical protein